MQSHRTVRIHPFMNLAMGLVILVLALFGSPFAQAAKPPLKTIPQLDLTRYEGRWYEIAYTPNIFERQCVSNTLDDYKLLPDGLVRVDNTCQKADGTLYHGEGRSKMLDATHARQKTTFLKLFGHWMFALGGDYWITALAPDYSAFIVAQPSRRYGWILARTPVLPKETLRALSNTVQRQGYDPCQWVTTVQTGGLQNKMPLCKAVR